MHLENWFRESMSASAMNKKGGGIQKSMPPFLSQVGELAL